MVPALTVIFAVLPVFESRTDPPPVIVKFGFVPPFDRMMPAFSVPPERP